MYVIWKLISCIAVYSKIEHLLCHKYIEIHASCMIDIAMVIF